MDHDAEAVLAIPWDQQDLSWGWPELRSLRSIAEHLVALRAVGLKEDLLGPMQHAWGHDLVLVGGV